MIKIVFEESTGTVLLDQQLHHIVDHCVTIDVNGWHLLAISSADTDHLQIKDILIENISIGQMMLIMFLEQSKQCTFGWVDRRRFLIPLHPNYATFRKVVFSHIDQGDYGTQIYQKYDFAFNQNPQLIHQYPKSVMDFFSDVVGPVWHKKYSVRSPWFLGAKVDRNRLRREVDAVKHKFLPRDIRLDSYHGWADTILTVSTLKELKETGLEYLSEILTECRFHSLKSVNIGYLPPGGYINSHKDIKSGDTAKNKVYIPVEFDRGNYFKFSSGGYVPLDQPYAACLNTDLFVHSVVNDSQTGRLIIGCNGYANWDQ